MVDEAMMGPESVCWVWLVARAVVREGGCGVPRGINSPGLCSGGAYPVMAS